MGSQLRDLFPGEKTELGLLSMLLVHNNDIIDGVQVC